MARVIAPLREEYPRTVSIRKNIMIIFFKINAENSTFILPQIGERERFKSNITDISPKNNLITRICCESEESSCLPKQ